MPQVAGKEKRILPGESLLSRALGQPPMVVPTRAHQHALKVAPRHVSRIPHGGDGRDPLLVQRGNEQAVVVVQAGKGRICGEGDARHGEKGNVEGAMFEASSSTQGETPCT